MITRFAAAGHAVPCPGGLYARQLPLSGGARRRRTRWRSCLLAQPAMAPARDAALEARIDGLLASMRLEEKVGQVIQADISTVTPEDVRRYSWVQCSMAVARVRVATISRHRRSGSPWPMPSMQLPSTSPAGAPAFR